MMRWLAWWRWVRSLGARGQPLVGNTRGASMLEYIIVVGVVALVAVSAFADFDAAVKAALTKEPERTARLDGDDGDRNGPTLEEVFYAVGQAKAAEASIPGLRGGSTPRPPGGDRDRSTPRGGNQDRPSSGSGPTKGGTTTGSPNPGGPTTSGPNTGGTNTGGPSTGGTNTGGTSTGGTNTGGTNTGGTKPPNSTPPACTRSGGCPAQGQCFIAGTPVQTASGPMPIEQIHIGDEVLSKDEVTGESSFRPVAQVFARLSEALIDVHVTSPEGLDETIRSTPEHPYWSRERGWVAAGLLRTGERLVAAKGGELEVTEVVAIDAQAPVFNLEVDRTHTYFAGALGAWVHNVCFGPPQIGTGALPNGPIKDIYNKGNQPIVHAGNFTPDGQPVPINQFDNPGQVTHVKPDTKHPANKGGLTPFTPVAPGRGTIPTQTTSVRPGGSSDATTVDPRTELVLTDCLSGCTVAVKPGPDGRDVIVHVNPPKGLSDAEKEAFVDRELIRNGIDPRDDRNTIVRPIDYGWTGEIETGSSSGGFFYGQRDPRTGLMRYYLVEYGPDNRPKASREVTPNRSGPPPGGQGPSSDVPRCALSGGCGTPGQCFVAGTPVLTPSGAVPIEQLREGDDVVAHDQATGEVSTYPVVTVFARSVKALVDVELRGADGRTEVIRSTPEHPYWSPLRGWVEAADLQPGETLASASGQTLWVLATAPMSVAEATVYNLEVDRAHTYFVGEHRALVHNDCTTPKFPIDDFTTVNTPQKLVDWATANLNIDDGDKKALQDYVKNLPNDKKGGFQFPNPSSSNDKQWATVIAQFAGDNELTKGILLDALGLSPPSTGGGSSTLGVNTDGSLAGRPAFTKNTAQQIPVTNGQHRRHVVAWHTIKTYLNEMRDDPAFMSELGKALQKIETHPLYSTEKQIKEKEKELSSLPKGKKRTAEQRDEAEKLAQEIAALQAQRANYSDADRYVVQDLLEAEAGVEKAASKSNPPMSDADKLLMKAAILMNSNRNNLWPGKGSENSTINAVASSLTKSFNDIKGAESPKDALNAYLNAAREGDAKKSQILNDSNRLAAERALGMALDLHGPKPPTMDLAAQQKAIDSWMADPNSAAAKEVNGALSKLTSADAKGIADVLHREIVLTHEIDVVARNDGKVTDQAIIDAGEIMHGVNIGRPPSPNDHRQVLDVMLPSVSTP